MAEEIETVEAAAQPNPVSEWTSPNTGLGQQVGVKGMAQPDGTDDVNQAMDDAILLSVILKNKQAQSNNDNFPVGLLPSSTDYFPSGNKNVLLGYYQGSVVGQVPIFGAGALMPYAALDKKREMAKWRAAQSMMPETEKAQALDIPKLETLQQYQGAVSEAFMNAYETRLEQAKQNSKNVTGTSAYGYTSLYTPGTKANTEWTRDQADMKAIAIQLDDYGKYIDKVNELKNTGNVRMTALMDKKSREFESGVSKLFDADVPVKEARKQINRAFNSTVSFLSLESIANPFITNMVADVRSNNPQVRTLTEKMNAEGKPITEVNQRADGYALDLIYNENNSDIAQSRRDKLVDNIISSNRDIIYDKRDITFDNKPNTNRQVTPRNEDKQALTSDDVISYVDAKLNYHQKKVETNQPYIPSAGSSAQERVNSVGEGIIKTIEDQTNTYNQTSVVSNKSKVSGGKLFSIFDDEGTVTLVPRTDTKAYVENAARVYGGAPGAISGLSSDFSSTTAGASLVNSPGYMNRVEQMNTNSMGGKTKQQAVQSFADGLNKVTGSKNYADQFNFITEQAGRIPLSKDGSVNLNKIEKTSKDGYIFKVDANGQMDREGVIIPKSSLQGVDMTSYTGTAGFNSTSQPYAPAGVEYLFMPDIELVPATQDGSVVPGRYFAKRRGGNTEDDYIRSQSAGSGKPQRIMISEGEAFGYVKGFQDAMAKSVNVVYGKNPANGKDEWYPTVTGERGSVGGNYNQTFKPNTYTVDNKRITPQEIMSQYDAYSKAPDKNKYQAPSNEFKNYMKAVHGQAFDEHQRYIQSGKTPPSEKELILKAINDIGINWQNINVVSGNYGSELENFYNSRYSDLKTKEGKNNTLKRLDNGDNLWRYIFDILNSK